MHNSFLTILRYEILLLQPPTLLQYTLAHFRSTVDAKTVFEATAYHTRNRLIEFWNDTQEYFDDKQAKVCYMLCAEYLLGTSLENAVLNLDIEDNYKQVREFSCERS